MSSDGPSLYPTKPLLSKERHVKYWVRCLKTHLPNLYTSTDGSRMMLAFFIVSALDLLSALDSHTTPEERADYIDYIYSFQHAGGGFRTFHGTDFGDRNKRGENERWDPGNVAGTFFALATLVVLGDRLERVRRRETLAWLKGLQLEDGSFAEVLGGDGPPAGEKDVRFCFLAALTRSILRSEKDDSDVEDIDVERLANFVIAAQSYDGGIAKSPFHESHAGCTYCGVSTLLILGKLPPADGASEIVGNGTAASQAFVQNLLHWLVSRQTSILTDYRKFDDGENCSDEDPEILGKSEEEQSGSSRQSFSIQRSIPVPPSPDLEERSQYSEVEAEDLSCAGFNGRCNKPADTCYSFWVGGALGVLDRTDLLNATANRNYLLEKTQHLIGGFGKMPGDAPDILHSYLGLAALANMGEPKLKSIDPILCMSRTSKEHIDTLPWRQKNNNMD